MNAQSHPARQPDARSFEGIVSNVLRGKCAFIELSNGDTAFVSKKVLQRVDLRTGDAVNVLACPTLIPSLAEKTPWHTLRVFLQPEADVAELRGKVIAVLRSGDAWTAEALAEEAGVPAPIAAALLEALYQEGNGAKYCRFRASGRIGSGGQDADLVAYSWVPDRVEIAEFEED